MSKVPVDLMDKAIQTWGPHAQLLMVLEEISELQKEKKMTKRDLLI